MDVKPHQPALRTTIAGLFVALGVPFVLILVFNLAYPNTHTIESWSWGIAAQWLNLGLLIGLVLFAEKCSLSSIGFSPLRWWTFPLGIVTGTLISFVFPLLFSLMSTLGISRNEAAFALVYSMPLFVRIITVVTAGVVEETLMRGYAIERLTWLLGNKWVAGVITLVFFTVAHFHFWGIANSIPIFLGAVLFTLLYVLWRNLTVNIIAHITTDAIGFVLVPLFLSR